MSKISSIYDNVKYLFRAGSRKGKTKESIENKSSSGSIFDTKKMKKMGVANKKINQHFDNIKKLSNKERLERIKRKK
tara:strand:- start:37 stop:267 length:231 start_codon:yes stop_codon:yes gene_type:complete